MDNRLVSARIVLMIAAVIAEALGTLLHLSTEECLPRLEPLPRNRAAGVVLGYIALVMCVPHAEVVAPDFLVPFLWPIALIAPWVCAFYVDNPTARAVGGLMILFAYEVVHRTFECRFYGAPVLAVAAWGFGIAGIWLSGYPVSMRDALRLAARRRWFRHAASGIFWGLALLFTVAAVVGRGGTAR